MKISKFICISVLAILLVAASSITVQAQHPSGWVQKSLSVYYYYSDGTITIYQQNVWVPTSGCFVKIDTGARMVTISGFYGQTLNLGPISNPMTIDDWDYYQRDN